MSDVVRRPPTHDGRSADSESDVWEALGRATSPDHVRPQLRAGVEIVRFQARTCDYAVARAPHASAHYQLESWEADLADRMDGASTLADLTAEALRARGDLRPTGVAELVEALRTGGFLTADSTDVWEVLRVRMDPAPRWRRRLRQIVRELSVEWSGADAFVGAAYRAGLKAAFHPVAVGFGAVLAVAGLVAFAWLVAPGRYQLTPAHPGVEFAVIWTLNLVIVFFHELGHALVLTHHGRVVRSAGFRLYFGAPTFFVDAGDALVLPRRSRIAQAFAGSYAEMVLAAPAAIALVLWPEMWGADTLYKWVVLNYFVMFMNLVPMLELDGYWMLADALRIPDLRQRSLAFVRRDLWQKLRRRQSLTRLDAGLGVFGFFGIVTTIFALALSYFFWEHLFLPVIQRMWGGGTSGRLLLAVLVVTVAGPAIRGLLRLLHSQANHLRDALWRARFRLQQGWRVDAAHALDATGIFGDVPVDVLNDLAGRLRLRTIRPSDTVVRQGDPADAYYLVRRGRLRVIEEHPADGTERVIDTLEAGDGFGELGLLEGSVRAATVRAVTRAALYELDGSSFRRLLAGRALPPDYRATLEQAERLRTHPAFRHLTPDQAHELAETGHSERVPPGTEIVRQGEYGDAFYAIFSGRAEVTGDGVASTQVGPGGYFGEVALVRGDTRRATVRAITPMRIFRLGRPGFERLVAQAFRSGKLRSAAGWDLSREH